MGESSSLAASLAPALIEACGRLGSEDRLRGIEWFRSSWQAGGASTAFAEYIRDDGLRVPCLVKLPVGPSEYRWTVGLGKSEGTDTARRPTPRVYAAGMELGGYDLAWVVLERIDGPSLSQGMDQTSVEDLLTTVVDWYERAGGVRSLAEGTPPRKEDWHRLVTRAREACKSHALAESQRWNEALKQVQKILPRLVDRWEARPINAWCHGDLHPGNALRRSGGNGGAGDHSCVLIDLALVHPGHWVEDAVYLERLFWAKPELLCGVKPVSFVAKLRKERGLGNGATDDHANLANIRRVLMAATALAFLAHEGHPKHVHASLEQVERLLPMVSNA